MLSSRFYKIAAFATNIACNVGAVVFTFDENGLLFRNVSDRKFVKRMKYSYTILCLWLFLTFLLIPKYWYELNYTRYYLTIFYSVGASAVILVCFSIIRWHSEEMCRTINSLLVFLRYFQGNLLKL